MSEDGARCCRCGWNRQDQPPAQGSLPPARPRESHANSWPRRSAADPVSPDTAGPRIDEEVVAGPGRTRPPLNPGRIRMTWGSPRGWSLPEARRLMAQVARGRKAVGMGEDLVGDREVRVRDRSVMRRLRISTFPGFGMNGWTVVCMGLAVVVGPIVLSTPVWIGVAVGVLWWTGFSGSIVVATRDVSRDEREGRGRNRKRGEPPWPPDPKDPSYRDW